MDQFLIENTTRQQREKIVEESLGYSDIGCGAGGYMYDCYQAYIDGEKELSEITKQFRTSYVSGEEAAPKGNCGYVK